MIVRQFTTARVPSCLKQCAEYLYCFSFTGTLGLKSESMVPLCAKNKKRRHGCASFKLKMKNLKFRIILTR